MNDQVITRGADNMRILSAAMVEKAKSGHPGGAMGGADFTHLLFSEFLNFNPDRMDWPFRDRFFLDPGHMSPMLYSVLALSGSFSLAEIANFRQWGSPTPGHPELNVERGVENTSGPLGQGHAMAVGAAIAERFIADRFGEWTSHKTYTFISDGGIQEEISQGAGRIAGYLGLNNLIMFFDSNSIQLSTGTDAVTSENTKAKYEAWGWRVIEIDGHDPAEIRQALIDARAEKSKPVLIIGTTIMGKGCLTEEGESFESQSSTHGQPIGKAGASYKKTILNLGGNPDEPFTIFNDVAAYWEQMLQEKRAAAQKRDQVEKEWRTAHPDDAAKLDAWLQSSIPGIDWSSIVCKPGGSTREASGQVLGTLAESMDNLIVMSADLANSDKTDGFLKKSKPFVYQDFSGAFLHAGVSELTMASLANGMALHGGVVPACGTFFVFSDYMKPAVRMAALMELQVIYIWTHDAFRVGEDGPTHQPIEQEAQIRLMESLKNHSGNPSVLVLRPADSAETVQAWRLALLNKITPTALLLSRQGVADLPDTSAQSRFDQAAGIEKGAYVVLDTDGQPDVLLMGNGSEVTTLYQGAELLAEKNGIKCRILSIPSEGLLTQQDENYLHGLIDYSLPIFALTAGLPLTMRRISGPDASIWGLDHFGYSAPAGVLDEKFGFTAQNVYEQVLKLLNRAD